MENVELLPEEVQPTTQELINEKEALVLDCLSYLASTDYIAIKRMEGEDVSKYGDCQEKRRLTRNKINELQAEVMILRVKLIEEQNETQG